MSRSVVMSIGCVSLGIFLATPVHSLIWLSHAQEPNPRTTAPAIEKEPLATETIGLVHMVKKLQSDLLSEIELRKKQAIHLESGTVGAKFGNGASDIPLSFHVRFGLPYETKPVVILGMQSFDITGATCRVEIKAENESESGFTIKVLNHGCSMSGLSVFWLAYGKGQ